MGWLGLTDVFVILLHRSGVRHESCHGVVDDLRGVSLRSACGPELRREQLASIGGRAEKLGGLLRVVRPDVGAQDLSRAWVGAVERVVVREDRRRAVVADEVPGRRRR